MFKLPLTPWLAARRGRNVRLERYRKVLWAALRTRGYKEILAQAGLTSAESIANLRSIEESLPKIPFVEEAKLLGEPSEFWNPAAPATELQSFLCPAPAGARTAVLARNFEETGSVRVFDPSSLDEMRRFGPETLAGPLDVLIDLTRSEVDALPSISHAVVAFTGLRSEPMSETSRD